MSGIGGLTSNKTGSLVIVISRLIVTVNCIRILFLFWTYNDKGEREREREINNVDKIHTLGYTHDRE